MSKFKLEKTFKLDFLGEGWKDSYITFKALTVKDLKRVMESVPTELDTTKKVDVMEGVDSSISLLKDLFIEGKALTEKGLEALSKDDLDEFPVEVLTGAMDFLSQASAKTKPQQ